MSTIRISGLGGSHDVVLVAVLNHPTTKPETLLFDEHGRVFNLLRCGAADENNVEFDDWFESVCQSEDCRKTIELDLGKGYSDGVQTITLTKAWDNPLYCSNPDAIETWWTAQLRGEDGNLIMSIEVNDKQGPWCAMQACTKLLD